MRPIYRNTSSHSEFIVFRDSMTGLGKTGIAFGDVTGSYVRQRSARVSITMASLAAATTAWTSGGWFEIDATNMPGLYRFDVPDNAFAAGADQVVVSAKATGAITEYKEFRLVEIDDQIAYVPHAAAGATGGLACLVAFGGTATAGGASTVTLPSPASTVADFYKGLEFSIIGGTGSGQSNICSAYSTGRVATMSKPWITQPDNTSVIEVRDIAAPALDANLAVVAASVTGAVGSVTGNVGGNVTGSIGSIATGGIVAGSYAVDAITSAALSNGAVAEIQSGLATAAAQATLQADTDDIQTRLPAALVSGRIDASVGAMAANTLTATAIAADAITAAKIAADAIGASELASDAVTEIQAGLTAPTTAQIVAAIKAMTMAENAQGLPAVTPTFQELLMWLYMEWRNLSTADSDSREIRNDAGVVVTKATLSAAGGTFSKGKFTSGP